MADEQGRPTEVHELNRQLADTIGASVEQLLGIGGTEADNMAIDAAIEAARRGIPSGQPGGGGEAHAETGQPGAPTRQAVAPAPVTAQEGEIDWEATKGANGLYLGKYKTKTEAAKGYFNLLTMAKSNAGAAERVTAERDRLAREVQELRNRSMTAPVVAPVVTPSPTPSPSRGSVESPSPILAEVLAKMQEGESLTQEDLLNVLKADREAAFEYARKAAKEEYDARAAAAKAEADRWGKVEAFMAENHPESVEFTDELALFIKTHPLIAAGVQALVAQDRHEEATEQAWNALVAAQGISVSPKPFVPAPATKENIEKEVRLDAADQVRREAVEQARRDAGVIGAGAAGRGVHENADAGPSEDEWEAATAQMRQGDGSKWRALVFRDALNHPLFGN